MIATSGVAGTCGKEPIGTIIPDGIDGNSPHAGAITENVAVDAGVVKGFLKSSNTGGLFQRCNGYIMTDPTHTNLTYIGVIRS